MSWLGYNSNDEEEEEGNGSDWCFEYSYPKNNEAVKRKAESSVAVPEVKEIPCVRSEPCFRVGCKNKWCMIFKRIKSRNRKKARVEKKQKK